MCGLVLIYDEVIIMMIIWESLVVLVVGYRRNFFGERWLGSREGGDRLIIKFCYVRGLKYSFIFETIIVGYLSFIVFEEKLWDIEDFLENSNDLFLE